MTKAELEQLYLLEQEINLLTRKIEQEEKDNLVHDTVAGSSPEFPYVKHSINIEGVSAEKKKTTRELLEELKKRCEKQKYELADYINSIEDSLVRQIITAKYLTKRKVSWYEVSQIVYGRADKEITARRLLDRYLEKH